MIIYDARHISILKSGLARYSFNLLINLINLDESIKVISNKNIILPKNISKKNIIVVKSKPMSIIQHIEIPIILYINKCKTYIYPHFDSPLFYFGSTINVIHDLGILNNKENAKYYGFIKRQIFKFFLLKAKLINSIKLVSISNFTKKDLINTLKIEPKKIQVIYEDTFINKLLLEKKYQTPKKNKPYLFYVGDRRPNKNLKQLIDIFLILFNKFNYKGELIIAGNPKNYNYNFDKIYSNYNYVKFVGIINDNKLIDYYRNMDALIFLSNYEGFGLPIVEAAKLKKKIIVNNKTALREISPSYALKININNSNFFIAKQIYYYLRKKIYYKNFDNYEKKFSWVKTARKFIKIYK